MIDALQPPSECLRIPHLSTTNSEIAVENEVLPAWIAFRMLYPYGLLPKCTPSQPIPKAWEPAFTQFGVTFEHFSVYMLRRIGFRFEPDECQTIQLLSPTSVKRFW